MLNIKRLFSQDFCWSILILSQINALSALLKEKGEEALMTYILDDSIKSPTLIQTADHLTLLFLSVFFFTK